MNQKITAFQFDATTVAPQAAFEAIPAGWYPVTIKDGEITLTEGGAGQRVNLEFEVADGPFKGRKVFDGFNTRHSNADTQRISQGQISAICHAVKTYQIADISALFNKPFQAKFGIEAKRTVDADGKTKDAAGNEYPEGTPNTRTYDAKNKFQGARDASGVTGATGVATGAPAGPANGGQPSWAVPGGAPVAVPGAGATSPFAPPPAAVVTPPPVLPPVVPPAAAPAAAKGKPGRKPGATKTPAKVERKFFVAIDSPEFAEAITESKLVEYLGKGLPADTGICLEGEDDYKTPAAYSVGAAPAAAPAPAAVVTPPPAAVVTPPPAPAAAAPAVDARPPWLR